MLIFVFVVHLCFASAHKCGLHPSVPHRLHVGGGFASAHKCGLHLLAKMDSLASQIFASAHKCGLHLDDIRYFCNTIIFASAHKCGLHLCTHRPSALTATLPQRTNADCIAKLGLQYAVQGLCLSAQMRIASQRVVDKARDFTLCLSAQMRIASGKDDRRFHGIHLCLSAQMRIASSLTSLISYVSRLCLSAQMRIASLNRMNYTWEPDLCLSAQMRIASGAGMGDSYNRQALPQRTNADCIGNIAQKCDILFCRLRCESVDSFSGITKDACADYFPVLFYCQGNQRCHYRQSRTDNRPVFYGANCTGFFCKLLLRTYARMLLRIPILESVFGISDNLRID